MKREWEEEVKLFALCCSDDLTLEADGWASPWEPHCRSLLKAMPKQEQNSRDGILGKVQSGSRNMKLNTTPFTQVNVHLIHRQSCLPLALQLRLFGVHCCRHDQRWLKFNSAAHLTNKAIGKLLVRPRQDLNLSFSLLKRRNVVVAILPPFPA